MGEGDDLGLAIAARRRIADFPGPVVVDRAAANDRADLVAVGQGGVETLQQHHAGAAAEHCPRRFGVEGAAVTVRRNHAALLIEIAALLREGDRYAARERHIGAIIEKALASFRDGKKRSRTRRLHGKGGTT
jgi:hypothetical protein